MAENILAEIRVCSSHFEVDRRYSSILCSAQSIRAKWNEYRCQYVIRRKAVLEEQLIPGQVYSLVYSTTIAGGNQMEALSDGDTVYQDLNASVSCWRDQRHRLIHAIYVTLGVEAVALLLIDRLGCKKEHQQIKKHRANIRRRRTAKKERNG